MMTTDPTAKAGRNAVAKRELAGGQGRARTGSKDTSPARIVVLPRSDGLFGAAVKLLSYIVYPGSDPAAERSRLQAEYAIAFEALKTEGNLPRSEIHVTPQYLSQSDAERKIVLRKVRTEMSRRQAAAKITSTLLFQLVFKQEPGPAAYGQLISRSIKALPERYRNAANAPGVGPAIEQLMRSYEEQLKLTKGRQSGPLTITALAGQTSDANNVQARALRPSYPILHMAVALDQARTYLGRKGGDELLAICRLVRRTHFMDFMTLSGTEVARLIALTPELKGAAKQLIRFELS